ncbi:MAG TPA: MotA/TolQ/ExbB proton channel family protein [Burkholderiaceae bacterium]|nr:MotA/TolQ/ExbB proton channel family protein [Burkholderiaceae bacterium]
MNAFQFALQGDAISQTVAFALLLMSVSSWVVILIKAWALRGSRNDVARSTAAFWQAPNLDLGLQQARVFDPAKLVTPLISAGQSIDHSDRLKEHSLAQAGNKSQQLTRVLRDALHSINHQLNFGQVLLATIGSTAPFVGLLGTVWGIYHALTNIAGAGQMTIAQISGPVGEALVMTAAGLLVAIPAVLAYNVFGRIIGQIEAELEGFANDLRDILSQP